MKGFLVYDHTLYITSGVNITFVKLKPPFFSWKFFICLIQKLNSVRSGLNKKTLMLIAILKKMNFVCFKLYVYVLPTEPYSVDRNFVFDRLTDELYPL